jgi:hypothetical protein
VRLREPVSAAWARSSIGWSLVMADRRTRARSSSAAWIASG